MIYILAAIIAIVVLGICITRKPYAEDKPGISGGVITVYVQGRRNSYSWGGMLTACVNQKSWTN